MKTALGLVFLMVVSVALAAAPPPAEKLNETIGAALFAADGTLWDESARTVARRLGLNLESATALDESYRRYASEEARILGRRPYSIALNAMNGKPVALNMVFANKGDSVGDLTRAAPGRTAPRASLSAQRDYRKAIRDDDTAIRETLTALLGAPTPQKMSAGREMRERALRWNWNGHAILLVSARDEYVAVRILPAADLDFPERAVKLSKRTMKERLGERVVRRENGDVILRDLPMTDQGPKGFCVPATMERVLRYFGIPADMYLLAMAAQTQPGGGTTIPDILQAVADPVWRAGRTIRSENGPPDLARVARWIESGLPIMWGIYTSETIDRRISEHTRARKTVTDWAQWANMLKPSRKDARRLAQEAKSGHICLIIGFNQATGELALSDSWGPGYEERWIPLEEAKAISQGRMALISW